MPYSYSKFKTEVAQHIKENLPRHAKILDIGAGSGVYADLLKENFPYLEAVEIHEPYIDMFGLMKKYMHIHKGNVLDWGYEKLLCYDYYIMGDVIEHMTYIQAKNFLEKLHVWGKKMLVAVPYLYEQGAEFNNQYETHLQPDLTHDIFLTRYPMMHLLYGDDKYGYYINYTPQNIHIQLL